MAATRVAVQGARARRVYAALSQYHGPFSTLSGVAGSSRRSRPARTAGDSAPVEVALAAGARGAGRRAHSSESWQGPSAGSNGPAPCERQPPVDAGAACGRALLQPQPHDKAETVAQLWRALSGGALLHRSPSDAARLEIPARPARPATPELHTPRSMPQRPKGESPAAWLLHGVAHIEVNAIDLYADTCARWYGDPELPDAMFVDLVQIAADEGRHFGYLREHLRSAHGIDYGDLPAHDGLWEHAEATADNLLDRLAIVPLVQEARALDSAPRLTHKLKSCGDAKGAAIVARICEEETAHVRAGVRWFKWLCDRRLGGVDPAETFQQCCRRVLEFPLPQPFDDAARELADLPQEWYTPVSTRVPREVSRVGKRWQGGAG